MIEPLTKRENEIMELLSHGYGITEIAEKLVLTVHTIKTHYNNVSEKMNIYTSKPDTVRVVLVLAYLKEKGVLPADFKIRGEL